MNRTGYRKGVRMRNALCFFVLLAFGSAAAAVNWTKLGTDDRGVTAYMDRDSISKDGALRYYSIKFVRPAPNELGLPYSVMKEKIDCAQNTVTTLSVAAYGANDSLIATSNEARPTRALAPQSNAAKMATDLCKL